MIQPLNAKIHETALCTIWIDENGILCANSKLADRTIENYKQFFSLIKQISKPNQKFCLAVDVQFSQSLGHDVRDYIAVEMPKLIKAQAVISSHNLEASQTTIFLKLSMSGLPVKLFTSESEAKEWLKEFL